MAVTKRLQMHQHSPLSSALASKSLKETQGVEAKEDERRNGRKFDKDKDLKALKLKSMFTKDKIMLEK